MSSGRSSLGSLELLGLRHRQLEAQRARASGETSAGPNHEPDVVSELARGSVDLLFKATVRVRAVIVLPQCKQFVVSCCQHWLVGRRRSLRSFKQMLLCEACVCGVKHRLQRCK